MRESIWDSVCGQPHAGNFDCQHLLITEGITFKAWENSFTKKKKGKKDYESCISTLST